MSKVEVDIYLNNLKRFFEQNPKDLFNLIGNIDKNFFYEKVQEKAMENLKKGEDVQLTQKQFLDILVVINKKNNTDNLFVNTKYASFCLN